MSGVASCKVPVGLAAALHEARVSPAEVLSAAGLPSRLLDVPGATASEAE
jgi:hypothetical protein